MVNEASSESSSSEDEVEYMGRVAKEGKEQEETEEEIEDTKKPAAAEAPAASREEMLNSYAAEQIGVVEGVYEEEVARFRNDLRTYYVSKEPNIRTPNK